ncbi:MAG: hypothetical protein KAT71_01310 [Gammaproteobacteria bacterium]|nr:hypothetical protein [Gammaproteobacteria bacterium]
MPLYSRELREVRGGGYEASDEEDREILRAPVSGPSFYHIPRALEQEGKVPVEEQEEEEVPLLDKRVAQGDPAQSGSLVLS